MKNLRDFLIGGLLFVWGIVLAGDIGYQSGKKQKQKEYDLLYDLVVIDAKDNFDLRIREWHLFIDALIEVESMNNDSAVGKSNDVGALQITPIYLEEANRIVGERRFTLNDRFNRYKSIEIFTIINEKYNPERSFDKALRLHNPGGGNTYRKKVMERYKESLVESR